MGVSETISQVREMKEVLRNKMNSYNVIIDTLRQQNNQLQAILDNGGQTSQLVGNQVQNVISCLEQSKNIIVTEETRLDNFVATLNQ